MFPVFEGILFLHPAVEFHGLMGPHGPVVTHDALRRFRGVVRSEFVLSLRRGVCLDGSNVDGNDVGGMVPGFLCGLTRSVGLARGNEGR